MTEVPKGTALGTVSSPYTFERLEDLVAPADGVLFGFARDYMVRPGDWAYFLAESKHPESAWIDRVGTVSDVATSIERRERPSAARAFREALRPAARGADRPGDALHRDRRRHRRAAPRDDVARPREPDPCHRPRHAPRGLLRVTTPSKIDSLVTGVSLTLYAMPIFWSGPRCPDPAQGLAEEPSARYCFGSIRSDPQGSGNRPGDGTVPSGASPDVRGASLEQCLRGSVKAARHLR